jgi:hypothetical protein
MTLRYGTREHAICCRIAPAKELRFFSQVPCSLERDTVGYAVCRFVRNTPALCHSCAAESYRIRLSSGRMRRTRRRQCILPALLLELPGSWAHILYTVDAVGVSIQEVRLLKDYPRVR